MNCKNYFLAAVDCLRYGPSMTIRSDFLARIDHHLAHSGMSEVLFGRQIAKNGYFVQNLRLGIGSVATIERVERYLDEHEPPPRAVRSPRPRV